MATISHHLHRIRQKPDHVKRHIAFWTSFGITLVIVMFWLAAGSFYKASCSVGRRDSRIAVARHGRQRFRRLDIVQNLSRRFNRHVSGAASRGYGGELMSFVKVSM